MIDGKALDTPAALAFLEHTASHNLEFLMPLACIEMLLFFLQVKKLR